MDINDLVRELDALISRLVRARGVLTGVDDLNVIQPNRGRLPGTVSKNKEAIHMSHAELAKIGAGLKARWAKSGKRAKTAQSAIASRSKNANVSAKKASARKSSPQK
jgi:hypothetical protein